MPLGNHTKTRQRCYSLRMSGEVTDAWKAHATGKTCHRIHHVCSLRERGGVCTEVTAGIIGVPLSRRRWLTCVARLVVILSLQSAVHAYRLDIESLHLSRFVGDQRDQNTW